MGGIPRAIREAAERAGLHPKTDLFNEAVRYVEEGHNRLAREHLQMLLCMAPDDGQALLLLARVHSVEQNYEAALDAVKQAESRGLPVPQKLRARLESEVAEFRASRDEHRAALSARNQGEVLSLREEGRRLRGENIELVGRVERLEREIRKWAWATLAASLIAMAFVGGTLILTDERSPWASGAGFFLSAEEGAPVTERIEPARTLRAEAKPPTAEVATQDPNIQDDPRTGVNGIPVKVPVGDSVVLPQAVIDEATEVLKNTPDMQGAEVYLDSDARTMKVTGLVVSYSQLKKLEHLLETIEPIESVDTSGLRALSRLNGTTHKVGKGDTLSHVAWEYYGNGMLTESIEQANGVSAKSIRPGMLLTVPPLPYE